MKKIITVIKKLKKKSKTVSYKKALKTLAYLKETTESPEVKAIGLCGPNLGIRHRVIYIDYAGAVLSIINPIITKASKQTSISKEGCLSLPETLGDGAIPIERPKRITLNFINEHDMELTIKFDGIIARSIQHEIDHLNGILITDYI